MKNTSLARFPLRHALLVGVMTLVSGAAHAQFDITPYFPSGVSVANVTPEQFTQAVFDAASQNPSQAAEIAAMSFESVITAGRYTQPGGKQDVDPNGSSGDPTPEEWATLASDAAKRAAPNMGPQIDSAVASALTSAQTAIANGTISPAGVPSSPDPGTGGPTAPPPAIPPGGGGGTSTSSTGASN